MSQKKLMLLGGIRYLLPVIKEAHKLGCYVITADYLPDNIAHKYSDEYVNVSIIDKDAVLKVAKEKQIDAIMSFACDPGVVSAAYVAEQLGLPFQCSYEAACILQDKSRFRKFLSDNGFNCPKAKGYTRVEDAIKDVDYFNWPIIVKPVDSAGSKGVTRVDDKDKLQEAIITALDESIGKHFIIEEFLVADGSPTGSESFFVNGELLYNAFYDQVFDLSAPNPFVPASECWPSSKSEKLLDEVRDNLQRLGTLLGIRTGIFNVEWRLSGGKVYLMEVTPRAGGNRLAEILNYATDVDIIKAETIKSLGLPCDFVHEPNYNGCYAIYNLHPDKAGVFDGIEVDPQFKSDHVVEEEIRVSKGAKVNGFTGANNSLGTLFLRFKDRNQMYQLIGSIHKFISVKIII